VSDICKLLKGKWPNSNVQKIRIAAKIIRKPATLAVSDSVCKGCNFSRAFAESLVETLGAMIGSMDLRSFRQANRTI
jgi:predicted Zn-ribbon and HTH transcriptional regulator